MFSDSERSKGFGSGKNGPRVPWRTSMVLFIVLLSGCKESVGPKTGADLVRVILTDSTFTLTHDWQGKGFGAIEVKVMNQSDLSLFVFKSCENPVYRLEKRIQGAWLEVGLAGGCLMGLRAEEVPAGESRAYSLGVLTSGPPTEGTYRVDLVGLSWISDSDAFLDAPPLPPSYRLSDEFQLHVEGDALPWKAP